jgi:glycosyltransferase involved in cell wall biosynthesis
MRASLGLRRLLHILLGAERGGCERDCLCICEYLRPVKHTVLVLGSEGPMSNDFARAGAEVIHLGITNRPRRKQAKILRNFLRSMATDAVIHWHGMPELPIIAHALSNWRGTIFVHGGNPARLDLVQDLKYLLAEQWWPSPHRPTYVCCSKYVANSFERSFYLRRFRRVVIPNGVELPARTNLHVPRVLSANDEITVGMMARLDVMKDQETVVRAVARARTQSLPNLRLELLGDGPSRSALQALANELGLGPATDSVRFLGNQSDIFSIMARWDLFLYATTEHEGFGNAVAEAMMLGLPSVVTDVGPMREVGGDTGAIVYVPQADPPAMAQAISELILDHPRRVAISQAARERASSEFNPVLFAQRYAAVLDDGLALLENVPNG